ncbi:MAG TPA: hypothetical protein PLP19_21985 [bacterium]|nr:hypothetical protein [bacterium]HPN46170.1 hypothetical protein [bacterium]
MKHNTVTNTQARFSHNLVLEFIIVFFITLLTYILYDTTKLHNFIDLSYWCDALLYSDINFILLCAWSCGILLILCIVFAKQRYWYLIVLIPIIIGIVVCNLNNYKIEQFTSDNDNEINILLTRFDGDDENTKQYGRRFSENCFIRIKNYVSVYNDNIKKFNITPTLQYQCLRYPDILKPYFRKFSKQIPWNILDNKEQEEIKKIIEKVLDKNYKIVPNFILFGDIEQNYDNNYYINPYFYSEDKGFINIITYNDKEQIIKYGLQSDARMTENHVLTLLTNYCHTILLDYISKKISTFDLKVISEKMDNVNNYFIAMQSQDSLSVNNGIINTTCHYFWGLMYKEKARTIQPSEINKKLEFLQYARNEFEAILRNDSHMYLAYNEIISCTIVETRISDNTSVLVAKLIESTGFLDKLFQGAFSDNIRNTARFNDSFYKNYVDVAWAFDRILGQSSENQIIIDESNKIILRRFCDFLNNQFIPLWQQRDPTASGTDLNALIDSKSEIIEKIYEKFSL